MDEKLLEARIILDTSVKPQESGWQLRYANEIKKIAEVFSVDERLLSQSFLKYWRGNFFEERKQG